MIIVGELDSQHLGDGPDERERDPERSDLMRLPRPGRQTVQSGLQADQLAYVAPLVGDKLIGGRHGAAGPAVDVERATT